MPNHYLFRVHDGSNFRASSARGIWGAVSKGVNFILREAKRGDLLWFVLKGKEGLILAVATYRGYRARTLTSEELGWTDPTGGVSDIEILYKDLYDLSHCGHETKLESARVYWSYNSNSCKVKLPDVYPEVVRYLKVVPSM